MKKSRKNCVASLHMFLIEHWVADEGVEASRTFGQPNPIFGGVFDDAPISIKGIGADALDD